MPVLDPASPPARQRRRLPPDLVAALAAHAERTGLDLASHLTAAEPGSAPAGPTAEEVAPGVLRVELPLPEAAGRADGGAAVAGLLPIAAGVPRDPAASVARLLTLSGGWAAAERRAADLEEDLDDLAGQLSRSFEELALYHRLTGLMQVTSDPSEFARTCAEQVLAAADVDAAAVVICTDGAPELFAAGLPLFNRVKLERLVRSAGDHDWEIPLVRNGSAVTLRGAAGVAAAPVRQGRTLFGWIGCANALPDDGAGPRPELGSEEGNLLAVVAAVLATHLRNQALFRDKEQMLLEFVLGLVQTLDARDRYTRGHSERVAVVAHRLARELGQGPAELDNQYLSGLLHDIGKVGIDDGVLRKPGKLTEEEFAQIQRHPMIGHDILAGIGGLREILPGVRSHHENFDGTGYPDGLVEGEIPLMARVMAVADAYDAMGSDRPYRQGMPVGKIERIFAEGRGTQWDPAVLDAYFACSQDVRRLWSAPGDAAARLAARARRRVAEPSPAPPPGPSGAVALAGV